MTGSTVASRVLKMTASLVALAIALPAQAQTDESMALDGDPSMGVGQSPELATASQPNEGDIIVTARKRDESLIRTPVTVEVFPAAQLERRNITDMYSFATVAPGITINPAAGPVGAVVFLRGLGNGDSASFIDQSVLLNVDGINQSHGAAFRTALFDVGQIEVLKGPQALFFGKSSSAGIIAIKSADPTQTLTSKVSVGYGFDADEVNLDGFVSGPITEDFGFRVAGFYRKMKGWLDNTRLDALRGRAPNDETYGGRVTLKYSGTDFRANLKLASSNFKTNGTNAMLGQRVCTLDVPQAQPHGASDNCKLDQENSGRPDTYPPFAAGDYPLGSPLFETSLPNDLFRSGEIYDKNRIYQGNLSLDWDIADGLTVSSLTGVVHSKSSEAYVGHNVGPVLFYLADSVKRKDFSQEVRLTSDFEDSIFNFTLGAFYANGRTNMETPFILGPPVGSYVGNSMKFKQSTRAVFGQALIMPAPEIELSLGARYTEDRKRFTSLVNEDNYPDALDPTGDGEQINLIPLNLRRFKQNNLSPEVTLTWRPTPTIMTYASYKRGYKGPGFNLNTIGRTFVPANAADLVTISPYGGEKAEGGEVGFKGAFADRQLTFTATAYYYKYDGLQVSFTRQTDAGTQFLTSNAASAVVKGVEIGATYRPRSIGGFSLSSFVNYNHGDYDKFTNAQCYSGQTAANGCVDIDPNPLVFAPAQDLSGHQLRRAPRWSGRVGMEYVTRVSERYSLGFSVDSNFSSKYYVTAERNPNGFQKPYVLLDAAVRVGEFDDGWWELELIGRNLTNKLIGVGGVDSGVNPALCAAESFVGECRADVALYTNRPREVMLRLTLRPHF